MVFDFVPIMEHPVGCLMRLYFHVIDIISVMSIVDHLDYARSRSSSTVSFALPHLAALTVRASQLALHPTL